MSQEIEQEKQNGFKFFRYVKESITEVKKVVWPKRPDAVRMTGFVLFFVAIFALFIYGVDSVISLLFNFILVR
ncbi:preprotein translocase subunit SecE [Wielerella bovis]|uniref:preprotein translocase subunit SecE n=1 Tax=Wielerella bovis TaxID=2917790 RepID=UPI0020199BF4|nr:preprotein translocase subunit SecE [Wielerella bovis]ULJ62608.1 preprotein translocase subunit SecE [Wielerella bovis]ULJ64840.1 preprotein translocase subunit SecE [Wielerella bovis]ULJ67112.1 preprotein translocase subunit SecE [Wielerella bovis]ULJ69416.1 preprotein translocase subunit SecE [Wielerella bovis]